MSSAQPASPPDNPLQAAPSRDCRDLNSAIEALMDASREAGSQASFVRTLLEVVAVRAWAMHAVLLCHAGASTVEHQVTAGETRAEFWDPTVRGMARESRAEDTPRARFFRGAESAVHLALIGIPFRSSRGDIEGSIALVAPCEDTSVVPRIVDELEALISVALLSTEASGGGSEPRQAEHDAAALAALQKAATFSSVTELAFAVTNKLKSRTGFEEVAFGRAHGADVEVLSIAGLDEVKRGTAGVEILQAAMGECTDLGRVCVAQLPQRGAAADLGPGAPLHRAWSEAYAKSSVASIPLKVDNGVAAVLCVRMSDGLSFRQEDLDELERLVAPYAPTLQFIEAARRSLSRHLVESASRAARGLLQRNTLGRKMAVTLASLFLLWTFFGSVPRSVRAPATIVPLQQYHVGTPLNGALAEVFVAPGDQVQAGEPLARFETRELVLEEARLLAEIELHTLSARAALATGAASDLGISRARKRSSEVALDLVRSQIERSTITAEVDGTVLEGDLRDRVGDTFSRGEPLFVVGSTSEWLLEIRVDESEILGVRVGMVGEFAALSRPEQSYTFEIERIRPSAVGVDGGNKFVAEGAGKLDPRWMRAGMEGHAKIQAGRRAPIAAVFGDAWNALRVRLWL